MAAALPAAMLAACSEPSAPGGSEEASSAPPDEGQSPSPEPEAVPGASDPSRPTPVVDRGPGGSGRVALTFDADLTEYMRAQLESGEVDTYHNEELLSYLESEDLAATFFMTGMWMRQYPDETSRIAANPRFELANHTFEHEAFTSDCYGLDYEDEPEAMREDVESTFDVMEEFGGNQTRYFRFPGLCHDEAALQALQPLGLTVVDGDVVSGDPFAEAAQPIVDAVLSRAEAGSVVIMHIGGPNAPQTHLALPSIVDELRNRGLGFGTLSEVLAD